MRSGAVEAGIAQAIHVQAARLQRPSPGLSPSFALQAAGSPPTAECAVNLPPPHEEEADALPRTKLSSETCAPTRSCRRLGEARTALLSPSTRARSLGHETTPRAAAFA
ncbi:hypothetical protein MRX96_032182 [Rhipicephalus microplus]